MNRREENKEYEASIRRARKILEKAVDKRKDLYVRLALFCIFELAMAFIIWFYRHYMDNRADIVAVITVYVSFIVFTFYTLKRYGKIKHDYAKYMVVVRSIIDELIIVSDWTTFRSRRLNGRKNNKVAKLVSLYNDEKNSYWSPSKRKLNAYGIFALISYIFSYIVFAFALYSCYKAYVAI